MKEESLTTEFLRKLKKLRKSKSALVHEISNILDMDEISVYRRLRGAVRFTVDEMGLLAQRLNISLDNLLSEQPEGDYQAWKMDLLLIANENGLDIDAMERNIPMIEDIPEKAEIEIGGSLGCLTRHFYMHYKQLWRFMHFKWGHYYSKNSYYDMFNSVQIHPRLSNLLETHLSRYERIKHCFFIWDSLIIQKFVNDVQYFKSMSLLTNEDALLIKEDITKLLNDCEYIAAKGKFEKCDRFDLYISPINIDTSHVYTHYGRHWHYSVEVYGIRPMITSKPYICEEFCRSINKLKNASILISQSAERERRMFFNEQRELIDLL
ncbi:helix-turn-helix domain-containing protein [Bacteroides sp. 519]|uniref:helix-turn-helix domain-containing protein n=1 Tax=Bacteroides sp. 519 TaxID=2302937 RepID=UPI0013D84D9D|nr:helix-turn-helix domain-containing protein [Bacteroides sp. 519]NDV60011.1 hypothetical protein [Bacteroides sp. 519]